MPRTFYRDPHHLVVEALQRRDLGTSVRAVGELRAWLDELEPQLVATARQGSWSWEQIADALRRSKQAVWERYKSLELPEVAHEPQPATE